MPKDLFSQQAASYARYRPSYPQELFDYVLKFTQNRDLAWDCATGNGQAAFFLADYFKQVEATDLSEAQLSKAARKENIHYRVCPAEQTPFPENHFDLITVAQAYHWLNWEKFHTEATRVGKANAVVAVWGYNLLTTDDAQLNSLLRHYYTDIVGAFWDAERKYVEQAYETIAFDFDPLPSREFSIELRWTKTDFIGYLQSWSAVQNYLKAHQSDPFTLIEKELDAAWTDGMEINILFPVFMKIGRIRK